jgi:hypothetical protein
MNMVAAGTVNAQGQVMIDTDVIRAALMSPAPGQQSQGPNLLDCIADAAQFVGDGIQIARLSALSNEVAEQRQAVEEAQNANTAQIAAAMTANKGTTAILNGAPNPSDPVGSILLCLQSQQAVSLSQQALSQAQADLDNCQDETPDFDAAAAGVRLAADFGAGSGSGMGGGGNGGALLAGGLAGAATGALAGSLTRGSRR